MMLIHETNNSDIIGVLMLLIVESVIRLTK